MIVHVGVNQGSVLCQLLFIMVEAISLAFINGCTWALLYGDDLVIIAVSVKELCQKLTSWKAKLENKFFRVNMKKIRVIFRSLNVETLINCGV